MTGAEEAPAIPENAAAPDAFIDKWRARWPEWAVAQVFVLPARRDTWMAWAALQQELGDAAWGGSDARPGEAKLGWWQEELLGWSRGLRRHPLGALLQARAADWRGLADALPALRDSRERPADAGHALRQVRPVAEAICRIDLALEGGAPMSPFGMLPDSCIAPVVLHLLHSRLVSAGESAVPLQALAQAGQDSALASWARRLPEAVDAPARQGEGSRSREADASAVAPLFRRIMGGLVRRRLLNGAADVPLPVLQALWTSWLAARN